jgi:hypothetical protein
MLADVFTNKVTKVVDFTAYSCAVARPPFWVPWRWLSSSSAQAKGRDGGSKLSRRRH